MKFFKHITLIDIGIFFALAIVALISFSYTSIESPTVPIWPLNGIALGLYLGFERKHLLFIVLGTFIGYLSGGILFLGLGIGLHLLVSFTMTLLLLLEIILFTKLMDLTKSFGYIGFQNFVSYLGILLLVTLVTSSVLGLFFSIVNTETSFTDYLLTIWAGSFISYLIFGTGLLLSFYYKEPLIKDAKTWGIIILVSSIYIFTCFLLLDSYDSHYTFRHYSYIFLIIYVFIGFNFTSRVTIYFNLIFVLFFQLSYVHTIPSDFMIQETLEAVLFLFILTYSTYLIQMTVKNLRNRSTTLESLVHQQDDLLASTINLFHLSALPYKQSRMTVEEYFIEMFKVANKVFSKFDLASCYLKGDKYVQFVDAIGYDVEKLNTYKFDVNEFYWTLETPKIILDADDTVRESLDDQYVQFVEENLEIKESIRFSIFVEDHIVGGMSFDISKNSQKTFTQSDLDNYTAFQKTMNSFFAYAMIIQKNETLQKNIVISLVNALELYDQYTGGHSEDVAVLAKEIAKRLGLSKKETESVYWAGITHDIGKIGVPQEIINKPGRLTEDEYNLVKLHSTYGFQILNRSEDLQAVALSVKHHHEWWDGTGYPDGLKEAEIPLASQILVCADAISSMATTRPYSKTKTLAEIRHEFERMSGIQFNPLISDIILNMIDDGYLGIHYKK